MSVRVFGERHRNTQKESAEEKSRITPIKAGWIEMLFRYDIWVVVLLFFRGRNEMIKYTLLHSIYRSKGMNTKYTQNTNDQFIWWLGNAQYTRHTKSIHFNSSRVTWAFYSNLCFSLLQWFSLSRNLYVFAWVHCSDVHIGLNLTNGQIIENITSTDTKRWIFRSVSVYPSDIACTAQTADSIYILSIFRFSR